MCKAVDQVIHAELVRLVGLIEWAQAAAGPLPELRDVGVVVDDGHQPLAAIVILEDALEDWIAVDVRLRELIQGIGSKVVASNQQQVTKSLGSKLATLDAPATSQANPATHPNVR